MSTILEALEKANKARKDQNPGASTERLAEVSARERRLREAEARHRRSVRLMAGGGVILVILLGASITAIFVLMKKDNATAATPAAETPAVSVPALKTNGVQLAAVFQEPPAAPPSVPAQAPVPVQAMPTPSPTPAPTPTPPPTPSPTPAPTATPTPTPDDKPHFSSSQVVSPDMLGVTIEGAMIDGSDSVVLIDNQMIEIGHKYKGIRPLSVQKGMIEAEYDQDDGQITLYIRY